MKTIEELNRLEQLAHDTGLRGEALEAEFQRTKWAEVKPLYQPSPSGSKLRKHFEYIYDQLAFSELTGRGLTQTFEEWLGPEFIRKHLS